MIMVLMIISTSVTHWFTYGDQNFLVKMMKLELKASILSTFFRAFSFAWNMQLVYFLLVALGLMSRLMDDLLPIMLGTLSILCFGTNIIIIE